MKRSALFSFFCLLLALSCLLNGGVLAYADVSPESPSQTVSAHSGKPEGAEADDGRPGEAENEDNAGSRADDSAMENAVIVEFDSVFYSQGETVYNNFGTVYNNGGVVYNNGGTVYNNSGRVYNNGGTVFNNGAEVFNNAGTVHNNGGIVHENGGQVEPSDFSGSFIIHPNADYSSLASIQGAQLNEEGDYIMSKNSCLILRAREGLYIDQATTTAGSCAIDTSGAAVLDRVDRDGRLSLRFKAYAPKADSPAGAYSAPFELSLSAGEAVEIHYTTDGSHPDGESPLYNGPIKVAESCVIKALAMAEGAESSALIELCYIFPRLSAPDFEPLPMGYEAPEPLPIKLTNPGLATVIVQKVSLAGEDAEAFVLSGRVDSSVRVSSGQTDERSWLIAPAEGLEGGCYEAEAVFHYAGGRTDRVKLRFTVEDSI